MYKVGAEVIKQESDDYIYFTGLASEFLILTKEEVEVYKQGHEVVMVEVPKEEYDNYLRHAWGFAGRGEVKENLKEHKIVKTEVVLENNYLDIFVVEKDRFLLLDTEYNLVEYTDNEEKILLPLKNRLNFEKGLEWYISKDNKYLALGENKGQKALLINLSEMKIEMEIDRGDYHTKHTHFPLLFFEFEDIEYFIYGADWDRVRIMELINKKVVTSSEKEELDDSIGSFWGRIIKHKDYIIADNWEWQPIGCVYSCNINNWVKNGYLADKDYTVIETAHYFWNRNITSYRDKIYIECIGRDDEELLEGLMIYGGKNLDKLDFIFGPKNILAIDKGLLYSQVDRFEVWDIEKKECIHKSKKLDLGRYWKVYSGFVKVYGNRIEVVKVKQYN